MKILLVDDERTEREGIRFLIEKFQFELEVAEAANGKLAMEYLQKYQDVDILLTDVKNAVYGRTTTCKICKGKQTGCDHYYIQCLQRV